VVSTQSTTRYRRSIFFFFFFFCVCNVDFLICYFTTFTFEKGSTDWNYNSSVWIMKEASVTPIQIHELSELIVTATAPSWHSPRAHHFSRPSLHIISTSSSSRKRESNLLPCLHFPAAIDSLSLSFPMLHMGIFPLLAPRATVRSSRNH
jgi:hypothetical protein